MDQNRNTPLHIIVSYQKPIRYVASVWLHRILVAGEWTSSPWISHH